MSTPLDLTDDQLGDQLRDLGAHLDLGPAGTDPGRAALVAAVLAALPDAESAESAAGAEGDEPGVAPISPIGGRSRRPDRPRWLAAAAIVLVVAIGVLAIAPAREAVAHWLGIGAVRIVRTDDPVTTDPSTTTSPGVAAPTLPDGSVDIDALVGRLPFPVRLPPSDLAGEPTAARVDPAVPSGLVEIHYPDFTLVEVASQPGGVPVLVKVLGPETRTTGVEVAGNRGLWITGDPHEVGFIDPDGETQMDRVRGAGDVLLWEEGGVTYRIEGAPSLDDALAIAASLR